MLDAVAGAGHTPVPAASFSYSEDTIANKKVEDKSAENNFINVTEKIIKYDKT